MAFLHQLAAAAPLAAMIISVLTMLSKLFAATIPTRLTGLAARAMPLSLAPAKPLAVSKKVGQPPVTANGTLPVPMLPERAATMLQVAMAPRPPIIMTTLTAVTRTVAS